MYNPIIWTQEDLISAESIINGIPCLFCHGTIIANIDTNKNQEV
jgi:hypothetical protein